MGNSGTTVRFLGSRRRARRRASVELRGDEAMARRPIKDQVEGLEQLGVRIGARRAARRSRCTGAACPVAGSACRGERSSQYFFGISAGRGRRRSGRGDPCAPAGSSVGRTSRSRGAWSRTSAAAWTRIEGGFVVRRAAYVARSYAIEPDASSAKLPVRARRGDGRYHHRARPWHLRRSKATTIFVSVLEQAGAEVTREPGRTTVRGRPPLHPALDVDMHDISDTVMSVGRRSAPLPPRDRSVSPTSRTSASRRRTASLPSRLPRAWLSQKVTTTRDSLLVWNRAPSDRPSSGATVTTGWP